ncbi:MAG: RlmE family RNA methyltransferase [Planctomycetota bacterium]|jgi:23S rRNA (uridine2552-2'-O)-methyltransferase|nr:RlmE family RNA methyltransferase [Planctomycetota bacterium]
MKKLHDKFFKQAKREGKLARSVYKLEELDRRERLLKRGDVVLDLGASPGSWLEYIIERIGSGGIAYAVDLKPINKKFKSRVYFKKMNVLEMKGDEFPEIVDGFDVVLSDMAPNTSGIKIVDQARSLELCEKAVEIAKRILKSGGCMVCKILYGPDTEHFRASLAKDYDTVKIRKPDASRDESTETYVLALGFIPPEKRK